VRYIGNKTKLLSFIGDFLDAKDITGGRALDAFAGTSAVGSFLKARGFAVAGCDIMTYSYVLQRAYVVADAIPTFDGLAADPQFHGGRQLADLLRHLETTLPPRPSFMTEHFSASVDEPSTDARMYFTRENAARIDAIRHTLHDWHSAGRLVDDEYFILMAALLEAADAVANTAGVYAAFLKRWQPNARKPLRLDCRPLVIGTGRQCQAHHADVNAVIDSLGHFDLLYLDPPYNNRQYSGYYHVPELLARGWFDVLPQLRGKTGLIPTETQQSAWSVRDQCVSALETLLDRADAKHVVMSYNNEGIIPEAEITRVFRAAGRRGSYQRVARRYARYRSDSDGKSRRYVADRVTEYLYYVRLR
jgi:adenine-specific DNA-methyltransferase